MTEQEVFDLVRKEVPLHEEAVLVTVWQSAIAGASFWSVHNYVEGELVEEFVVTEGEVRLVPDLDSSELRIVNKYLPDWLQELDGLSSVVLLEPNQECELFVENRTSGFAENVNAWSRGKWAYIECQALKKAYRLELTDGCLTATWAD